MGDVVIATSDVYGPMRDFRDYQLREKLTEHYKVGKIISLKI